MEIINLLLARNSRLQAKFNAFYSNSELNRQHLSEVLLSDKDILNLEKVDRVTDENGSVTLLNVLLKTLGVRLDKD